MAVIIIIDLSTTQQRNQNEQSSTTQTERSVSQFMILISLLSFVNLIATDRSGLRFCVCVCAPQSLQLSIIWPIAKIDFMLVLKQNRPTNQSFPFSAIEFASIH